MKYTLNETLSNFNKVTWRSPSNIALVKYWGKKDIQLPMNPSLSMTLSESYTETTLYFREKENTEKSIDLKYYFDGKEDEAFTSRVRKFLTSLSDVFPFLFEYEFIFQSANSFPHSAGIASSASAFSAIALCLKSLPLTPSEGGGRVSPLGGVRGGFEASHLARIGSGSACRSVFGRYVSWGATRFLKDSSDGHATPIEFKVHDIFQNLHDSILIVDDQPKKVSSSLGHKLLEDHPYAKARFDQAYANHGKLLGILQAGDFAAFSELVEDEAMSIHALMMTSSPSYCLMKPNTLNILDKIKKFRAATGIPICFTLDAGPNVHLLYPEKQSTQIVDFINEELKEYCFEGKIIHDKIGDGPVFIGGDSGE